jgi:hypothetical protein
LDSNLSNAIFTINAMAISFLFAASTTQPTKRIQQPLFRSSRSAKATALQHDP